METVIVGERGQITVPKRYREKLGIKPKSPVIVELTENGLFIKPAVTVPLSPLRQFPEEFIQELQKEDLLKNGERKKILAKWKKS